MFFLVGILHFASCPNLKMDTKEALSASAFGRMEPFSLLTYFDWLLKWNQMADQFSSDLAIFQLLQKAVFNLYFDLDNIIDFGIQISYSESEKKEFDQPNFLKYNVCVASFEFFSDTFVPCKSRILRNIWEVLSEVSTFQSWPKNSESLFFDICSWIFLVATALASDRRGPGTLQRGRRRNKTPRSFTNLRRRQEGPEGPTAVGLEEQGAFLDPADRIATFLSYRNTFIHASCLLKRFHT